MKRELDSLVTQMHSSGIPYEEAVREFKRQYLREVLLKHRGNQCKAAEELGMHRNTLSRAMSELGSPDRAQASGAQRTSCIQHLPPGLPPGMKPGPGPMVRVNQTC